MRLTWKYITRHIARCFLDSPKTVKIGPDDRKVTITRYRCSEFNVNTVTGSRARIYTGAIHNDTDARSAVIEWQVSGDLEIEISKTQGG